MNNRFTTLLLVVLFVFAGGMTFKAPEEGMYPLSEIKNVNLSKAGLQIPQSEIYNPDGVSLVDALVNLSGCTASFVSPEGLILTNHHCAFRAISNASTPAENYLEKGFAAKSMEEEIPAPGYTCRITESYQDVTEEVLGAVEDVDDLAERSRKIDEKIKELEEEYTDEEKSIEAEVSEMFKGESYVLFKYRTIKDVRLVYAPPRSIGEFGGDKDNWEWPRHTGDFSFMRAYVAPDGSSAEYSEENVPFQPKKHIKVAPQGVSEGDFVFILGYPGRTYRNRPTQYIEYQYDYRMPYRGDLFRWYIEVLEKASEESKEMELKYVSLIKGLSNVEKNYRGKMLGIKRINLLEKRYEQDKKLKEFINSKPELTEKYGALMAEIDKVYDRIFAKAKANMWFSNLFLLSPSIRLTNFLLDYAEEMKKPEDERASRFKPENIEKTKAGLDRRFKLFNETVEKKFLSKMISDALVFPEPSRINTVDSVAKGFDIIQIEEYVSENLVDPEFINKENILALMEKEPDMIQANQHPLVKFVKKLREQREELREESREIDGAMNKLSAQYIRVKKLWQEKEFIPDANGTLRLTYGSIKGYNPKDAVHMSPITTLDGVIDKSYRGGVYEIPEKLKELYENKEFGDFYNEELGGVPVGILYNMDTTGGNSGSPIFNAKGELVGVNFDRAFEATINDFAYDDSYSRSNGVDISYILWLLQEYAEADNLLKEMGV
jgi:hypothetical protein